MPSRSLFDSTSLTSPLEPRVDLSTLTNSLGEGLTPEAKLYPDLKAALDALDAELKRAPAPKTDFIDAVIRQIVRDGEAFLRVGHTTYRYHIFNGELRSEVRLPPSKPTDELYSYVRP